MENNQKILIGCGGAGCLGLLFLCVAAGAFYYYYARSPLATSGNSNTSTYNSSNGSRSNSNTAVTTSTMSEDDKHKLFQAAGVTGDGELITRVLKKLGFMRADGTTTPEYTTFINTHGNWATHNIAFINQYRTPERARQYVMDHIND